MFIVKFKGGGGVTRRRFHVHDSDLAMALVWAGLQLGWTIRLQLPDGQLLGN